MFIADRNNHSVRKVTTQGIISTIAGNGIAGFSGDGGLATSARLFLPSSVWADSSGRLYIADRFNQRIRKILGLNFLRSFALLRPTGDRV